MSLDHFLPDAFFADPELNQIMPQAVAELVKDEKLSQTRRYMNYTGKVITVIERSGLRHEFAAIPCFNRSSFVVTTDWKIHKSLLPALSDFIKQERENESKLIRKLRELLVKYQPTLYDQQLYLRTELEVKLNELEAHRGEIYDHEHDIVISLHKGRNAGPHPYSGEGRALALMNGAEQMVNSKAFSETIQVIDNDGTYGDRFINRNKMVYRIEAVVDQSRLPGVWVIRNRPFENTRLPGQMGWQRYTFEEADKILELYKTYAEALHCGDAEHQRKQAAIELETKLIQERAELAEQKIRHQREQQEWESDRARTQMNMERQQAAYADEAFRAKMELDRVKHNYDRQLIDLKSTAERRKETNEWMKQIPAILGALGVAWLSYKTAQYAAKRATKDN